MLVFISWSGQRSKVVAEALETWLAQVIQAVEPWISQDIDKGSRWGAEIAGRLELSKVGIICLTKSNLDARWIHFEAGALSKTKDAYVCALLLGIKQSEVKYPLAQFQHTTAEKEDIFKLLSAINRAVENSGERTLPESRLRAIFETYWPKLERVFQESATLQETTSRPSRTTDEMLQEILETLRNQERRRDQILRDKSPYRLSMFTDYSNMTAEQYITMLETQKVVINLTTAERAALVNGMKSGTETYETALRKVEELKGRSNMMH